MVLVVDASVVGCWCFPDEANPMAEVAFGQLAVSLITAYLGVLLVRGFQGMGGSICELLFWSQDTLSRTLASIHRDAERDCLEKRAEAHR